MNDIFLIEERQYHNFVEQINLKLSKLNFQYADHYENQMSAINDQLQDAEKALDRMRLEQSGNREFTERLKNYRINLQDIKKLINIKKQEYLDFKNSLSLPGSTHNLDQKLLVQNKDLEMAKMNAYETSQVADNIQLELQRQSDILKKDINKGKEMNVDLMQSNSLIFKMKERIKKNKRVRYLLFGFMATCLILIFYLKT